MNQLQNKLLEMLKWLSDFLRKNNLTYYIIGGTMLGAARHKGFIPWDDDIDIALPRPDYEKLVSLLKEPIDHYVVESPYSESKDYIYPFAKFYDTDTTLIEHLRYSVKRGVYIDVFPIDGIGNTLEESRERIKKTYKLNTMFTMKVSGYRKGRKWWKNCAAILGAMIPLKPRKISQKINSICSSISYNDTKYVRMLDGSCGEKSIVSKDVFGTPVLYPFENIEVYGPEKYDDFLTNIYGDWRQLPPEEARESAHMFMDIDFNKSYLGK